MMQLVGSWYNFYLSCTLRLHDATSWYNLPPEVMTMIKMW